MRETAARGMMETLFWSEESPQYFRVVRAMRDAEPEGLVRDVLFLVCARCPDHVGVIDTEDEVDKIIERWTGPSSEHPFVVAEVFFQAARFYAAQPENCAEKNFDCNYCLGFLKRAMDLWGTENAYLHRRAEAETLASILEEDQPSAALSSATRAVVLWSRRLELDPMVEGCEKKWRESCSRALKLAGRLHELWKKNQENAYLEDMCQSAQALVMRERHARGTSDP